MVGVGRVSSSSDCFSVSVSVEFNQSGKAFSPAFSGWEACSGSSAEVGISWLFASAEAILRSLSQSGKSASGAGSTGTSGLGVRPKQVHFRLLDWRFGARDLIHSGKAASAAGSGSTICAGGSEGITNILDVLSICRSRRAPWTSTNPGDRTHRPEVKSILQALFQPKEAWQEYQPARQRWVFPRWAARQISTRRASRIHRQEPVDPARGKIFAGPVAFSTGAAAARSGEVEALNQSGISISEEASNSGSSGEVWAGTGWLSTGSAVNVNSADKPDSQSGKSASAEASGAAASGASQWGNLAIQRLSLGASSGDGARNQSGISASGAELGPVVQEEFQKFPLFQQTPSVRPVNQSRLSVSSWPAGPASAAGGVAGAG